MEMFGFEVNEPDKADLADGIRVMQRDVVPMMEGAHFVSQGAPPLMPAPEPGDMTGIYWGTSTWYSVGMDGLMQWQIDHRWLPFWPDGMFYDGPHLTGWVGLISQRNWPRALWTGAVTGWRARC
jgi:hypothetical protein